MKKSHRGFTALELLVVIGIIGVIVAIALVGLDRAREKSRDDSRVANIRTIQIALEDYKTACRTYPIDLNPTTDNCLFVAGTSFGEFLRTLPVNPGGTPFKYYAYANPGTDTMCIGYHIAVELESEKHGGLATDDDFNSIPGISSLSVVPCQGISSSTGAGIPGTGFDGSNDLVDRLYDKHQ